jgi:hypothetical protein
MWFIGATCSDGTTRSDDATRSDGTTRSDGATRSQLEKLKPPPPGNVGIQASEYTENA